tara:strand:+ start:470 stop:757 length:288 start_codon:yes stop_codon:yes gene_type:complete
MKDSTPLEFIESLTDVLKTIQEAIDDISERVHFVEEVTAKLVLSEILESKTLSKRDKEEVWKNAIKQGIIKEEPEEPRIITDLKTSINDLDSKLN